VNGQKLTYPRRPDRSHLELSSRDVKLLTASHRTFLRKLGKLNTTNTPVLYSGEGIVMVAGGEFYGPALVTLRMLRRTGCTLPVELFLGTDEEYEPALCEAVLPALGARCVVISGFLSPPLRKEVVRFQLKSLALLFSSFERVVYLDSDSIPLINPESLLESKQFRQAGLLLWPDFWIATEDPRFYDIAGVEGGFPSGLPVTGCETGQMVLDKTRHLRTLLLAVYYNIWGPKWYYELLSQGALGQGDKETFLAAAVVLGTDWYRVKTSVESVGYRKRRGNEFRATGMTQFWEGKPAFMHANTPKMNAGHLVDEGDLDEGVRLWGTKHDTLRRFGSDLERTVWEELVDVGCSLAEVVGEWKGKRKLCQRLKRHWVRAIERDW
jgi:alpha 1,2-mannosyltransferase